MTVKVLTDYPVRSDGSGEWVDPAVIARVAQTLETLGFDGLGFTDHPAPSRKWLEGGGHETFDPFSAMSFCAAVTSRLTVLSHLLVVPYRSPLLQASAMATVDVLAGGRTIFVLGAGYLRSEFAALGVDFDERNDLFDEGVDVIRRFCAGDELQYEGRHFTALGQRRSPASRQRPHPPLWVGGNSGLALDRVARWGQGWSVMWGSPEVTKTARTRSINSVSKLADAIRDIERRATEHGRAMSEISISAASPAVGLETGASAEQQVDAIGELSEIGVSHVRIDMGHDTVEKTLDRLQSFSESVMARVR